MRFIPRITAPIVFGLLLAGCSDVADPPAPVAESQPTTVSFTEAVEEIVRLRGEVRDGFAADDIDAAHGPLHDVGDRLTELPGIAQSANLSAEELASVNESVETLMNAFGAIDATLHGQEGSTYDDEASKITAAIDKLTGVMKSIEPD